VEKVFFGKVLPISNLRIEKDFTIMQIFCSRLFSDRTLKEFTVSENRNLQPSLCNHKQNDFSEYEKIKRKMSGKGISNSILSST